MKIYTDGPYTLRKLTPREGRVLKAIYLEAMAEEPNVFIRSRAEEAKLPDAEWSSRLRDTGRAYLALFHFDDLVGFTGVARHARNKDTAVLTASYIQEAHREKGLSHLYYKGRIEWARRENFARMVVSHRQDNDASRAAILKFGFQPTHSKMTKWPDGTEQEQVFYELDLSKPLPIAMDEAS